mmetsp:Transcript_9671/g.17015  ORF Transcript_9671/g.17015 Transcript_9671/m.17015 type:complete len:80 (-) Transcript_9671:1899-2138(-)
MNRFSIQIQLLQLYALPNCCNSHLGEDTNVPADSGNLEQIRHVTFPSAATVDVVKSVIIAEGTANTRRPDIHLAELHSI